MMTSYIYIVEMIEKNVIERLFGRIQRDWENI